MSAYKTYWIYLMVNLERGRQYFIYGGYIITFGQQVQICFDTKSPLENSIPKWGGTKQRGRLFCVTNWQSGAWHMFRFHSSWLSVYHFGNLRITILTSSYFESRLHSAFKIAFKVAFWKQNTDFAFQKGNTLLECQTVILFRYVLIDKYIIFSVFIKKITKRSSTW